MICTSCRRYLHTACRGGSWCDCQHSPKPVSEITPASPLRRSESPPEPLTVDGVELDAGGLLISSVRAVKGEWVGNLPKHVCDETCVCPIHKTALIFWPAENEHACQDVDCVHGKGLDSPRPPRRECPDWFRSEDHPEHEYVDARKGSSYCPGFVKDEVW